MKRFVDCLKKSISSKTIKKQTARVTGIFWSNWSIKVFMTWNIRLKGYLANYDGTFIIISHDKIFLNDGANYTLVLDDARMTKVKGNYEEYEAAKEIRNRSLEKQQKVVEAKREQLERFAERFHAQPNMSSAVRNKRKMLDRLEVIRVPQEKHSIRDFEFPATMESGYSVLTLSHIDKAYGEKQIYKGLDFEITKGQKLCLVGHNGAGKST